MTDDSLTPPAELASAALDNEVTSAERANIVGSLVLSAEMGVYGEIRAWLADVDVPPAARENALAAALAAFDEMQTGGAAVSGAFRAAPAGVASLRGRRRRSDQWFKGLAAAAVVAAVAVGAIAVLGGGRGSDNKSSSATQTQAAEQSLPRVASAGAPVDANADTALTATATAGSVPALEASVSPWSTAPMLNSDEAVLVFVSTPDFGAMHSSTSPDASGPASSTAASASAAASSAGTTAGTTAGTRGETTAPAPGADGGAKGSGGSAIPCINGAQPSALAYYKGQRAVVVSDTGRKLISVVDADTCGLITTIKIP